MEEKDRLCKFCDTNTQQIENDLHFMFYCEAYSYLRVQFLNHVLQFYPDFIDFEDNLKWEIIMGDTRIM